MRKSLIQLTIRNLHAAIEGTEILHGINLTVQQGEVHAVMGPNGSGKSTLAYVLAGHPAYQYQISKIKYQIEIPKTGIWIDHKKISELLPEERARAGLFLAFQSPIAIPGVSVLSLLRTAYQELYGKETQVPKGPTVQNPALARQWKAGGMTLGAFTDLVKSYAEKLHLDESFLRRGIHDGFSGGEKKKVEMLTALVLKPKFAIFDEIDTGLDVDALKTVAGGINLLKLQGTGMIIITHYQRILHHITPDYVHVLIKGKIVKSGRANLAAKIERTGYRQFSSI